MAPIKRLTLYAAGTVIAMVGWILNVPQLYWMAGTCLLLPTACRLYGRLEHRGLTVRRRLPAAGHQGEAVEVRFLVQNLIALPKLHLGLKDDLPLGLSRMEEDPVPVHLAPHGTDEAGYTMRLQRRGEHTLPAVRVTSTDPLGLSLVETRLPVESRILVYPRVVPLPTWVQPPDIGGGQAPLEASRRQGEGSSFFGIREYRPGDPLRHVHWRTAARWRRLAVVEWEADESTDALLALETRRGTERDLGSGTTLDLAAGLAASLASEILGAGDALRLLVPGLTEWRPLPHRGIEAMPGVLEALARMRAEGEHSLAGELRQLAPQLAPGMLVCWITATPSAELVETARFLRSARLQPVIYAIVTPDDTGWDAVEAELGSSSVRLIRLNADDDLAKALLD